MSKRRIVVVDDDERLLLTTKGILEDEGYEVHTVGRALGATNTIMDLAPDLVLLDINMPGLSGESLAKVIRVVDRTREVPIVFHSSNDEDSLRKSVASHGARGYICKGDIRDLKRKVAHYIYGFTNEA